jgi:hypothetical protein
VRHRLQGFGRLADLGDVVQGACQDQRAGLVAVGHAVQAHMPYRPVWPDDTVLELGLARLLPVCPDPGHHRVAVVRMNQGQVGLDPAVEATVVDPQDAAGLGTPDQLFWRRVEFPGADVTDALDLGQLPFDQLPAVPCAGLFNTC